MNRRHFLRSIAGAVAGFTILPPATTYSRIWKATRPVLKYRTTLIGVWEMLQSCEPMSDPTPLDIDKMIALMYQVSRERRAQDQIEIIVPTRLVDWVRHIEV